MRPSHAYRQHRFPLAPFRGKLGLALSGGGFRASFFHIGVLARLAEIDWLRHVEVISTVSGGSIVGAFYYIKLKRLLEEKPDDELTRDDYVQLVQTLSSEFTEAVQKNPRLLAFINPLKNLRTRRPDYSRTDRMGELLDGLFYRPLMGGERIHPVEMRELRIVPKGEDDRFHPETDNRRRRGKVPILLLNATTLNTGRNWRFEAIRMGEPPPMGMRPRDLDRRRQLLRPERYELLPERLRRFPLGAAVAASAAVPGYFPPLSISGMYPRTRVELVDGGVHDNQGIQGLIDRGCTRLIVSDGSYQMRGQSSPATTFWSVLLRSQSIMSARLREEQVIGADCREGIADVHFVHMRQGLVAETVPYVDASPVEHLRPHDRPSNGHNLEVDPDVQQLLSGIRTDLDGFHDVESYSLMRLGYVLAGGQTVGLPGEGVKPALWDFHRVATVMARPNDAYRRLLQIGQSTVFKLALLHPSLFVALGLLVLAAVALVVYNFADFFNAPIPLPSVVPTRLVGGIIVGTVALFAYGPVRRFFLQFPWIDRTVSSLTRPVTWIWRLLFRGLPSAVASGFIALYLKWCHPLYLKAGRVEKVMHPPRGPAALTRRSTRPSTRSGFVR